MSQEGNQMPTASGMPSPNQTTQESNTHPPSHSPPPRPTSDTSEQEMGQSCEFHSYYSTTPAPVQQAQIMQHEQHSWISQQIAEAQEVFARIERLNRRLEQVRSRREERMVRLGELRRELLALQRAGSDADIDVNVGNAVGDEGSWRDSGASTVRSGNAPRGSIEDVGNVVDEGDGAEEDAFVDDDAHLPELALCRFSSPWYDSSARSYDGENNEDIVRRDGNAIGGFISDGDMVYWSE
ncbi:uncharacterized protein K460DRAFT_404231 [Cucurbitaria berberidis CBS 394.84]|uniref:Uncharacterized protein n=1 Tax=Cucurbitaria berberidis CBS 394.84 TaxID=1168544 RepID=A0A9P4GM80_9PLEO|nr:uncharacterized protein K460DRAFT_404231 [Cucurbitaria berberidis CBS 394.84]KAF1848973.1 hypothetical protein K460DRAFT_404231 [Cucurbitaria berberidis CBS 394.84]